MTFRLYFAGAEVPGWRNLLAEEGAKNVALSFTNLRPRLPKKKPYLLADRFPDDQRILLDSGAYATKTKTLNHDDHMEAYKAFVMQNLDRLDLVTEYDPEGVSPDWIQGWRQDFWDDLPPEKFMPIWHERYGVRELERMAEQYDHLGITKPERNITARLNGVVQRYGVELHGVAITRPDILTQVRFSSAMSTSWISPMRYGETHVWDGHHLRWYPQKMKDQARRRHRMLFTRAGFDAEAIANDNNNEVARFTIWSWLRLEESMATKRVRKITRVTAQPDVATTSGFEDDGDFAQTEEGAVDTAPARTRNMELVPRDERVTLPVFSFEARQGMNIEDGSPERVQVPVLTKHSHRRCDSCYISNTCPAFEPGAECKFDLPVEIRTKDQLLGALTALLEMQMGRVAFGRFAEELEGGYPDPNVSSEMDRFMKMTLAYKEIQDNRDFMKVTVEARGQAGVLSRLFGDQAGEQARTLERPLDPDQTDRFLGDFIEGQVVDG